MWAAITLLSSQQGGQVDDCGVMFFPKYRLLYCTTLEKQKRQPRDHGWRFWLFWSVSSLFRNSCHGFIKGDIKILGQQIPLDFTVAAGS